MDREKFVVKSMVETQVKREAFIPCSREDLIEFCLQEGRLTEEDMSSFRTFAELLAVYYHFRFYQLEKRLKQNYAPFNPDADVLTLATGDRVASHEKRLA